MEEKEDIEKNLSHESDTEASSSSSYYIEVEDEPSHLSKINVSPLPKKIQRTDKFFKTSHIASTRNKKKKIERRNAYRDIKKSFFDDVKQISLGPNLGLGNFVNWNREPHSDTESKEEFISYSTAVKQVGVPMAVLGTAQLFLAFSGFITTYTLSKNGTDAVAAGNLMSSGYALTVTILSNDLSNISLIAKRKKIAVNEAQIGKVLQQGCLLGLLLSIPIVGLTQAYSPILNAMGQPEIPVSLTQDYFQTLAPGIPFMMLLTSIQQIMLSVDKTSIAFLTTVLSTGIATGLGYFLGTYSSGIPWLEVAAGIGAAMTISRVATLIGVLPLLKFSKAFKPYGFFNFSLNKQEIKELFSGALEIFKSGLPLILVTLSEIASIAGGTFLAGSLGKEILAAQQLVFTYYLTAFAPLIAMSIVGGMKVAEASKKNSFVNARRLGYAAIGLGVIYTLAVGGVFVAIPEYLGKAFTDDAQIISSSLSSFRISGATLAFDGLRLLAFGTLNGFSDVKVSSLLNIVACVVSIGLGYGLMEAGLGLEGIFWARCGIIGVNSLLLLNRWRYMSANGVEYNDPSPSKELITKVNAEKNTTQKGFFSNWCTFFSSIKNTTPPNEVVEISLNNVEQNRSPSPTIRENNNQEGFFSKMYNYFSPPANADSNSPSSPARLEDQKTNKM